MNRKALIIGSPGTLGTEFYCEGVNKDIENYKTFLMSPIGGLWRDNEIKILKQPGKSLTETEVDLLTEADYSLTVFCGHGYYSQRWDSTIVELNPEITLDSKKLRIGAKKHTLILDCCREKVDDRLLKSISMEAMYESAHKANKINPSDCRKLYDQEINSCSQGLVVLHACSIDERAGDMESRGGYYSYNLIKSAKQWESNTYVDTTENYQSFSIVQAHQSAVPKVKDLSGGRQTPTIEKPRSDKYFPFCIIA